MQKKQEKDEAADKINHDSEGGAEAQNPFHDGLPAHQNDAGDQARAEQQRRVVGAWRQKVRNGDHQQSQKGDGANKRRGDGHQNGDHSEGEQLHGADILPQIDRHIIAQRNYVQPMADGPHKDQANDDDRHADIKQVHIETVEAGVRRDLNMGIFIGVDHAGGKAGERAEQGAQNHPGQNHPRQIAAMLKDQRAEQKKRRDQQDQCVQANMP